MCILFTNIAMEVKLLFTTFFLFLKNNSTTTGTLEELITLRGYL